MNKAAIQEAYLKACLNLTKRGKDCHMSGRPVYSCWNVFHFFAAQLMTISTWPAWSNLFVNEKIPFQERVSYEKGVTGQLCHSIRPTNTHKVIFDDPRKIQV